MINLLVTDIGVTYLFFILQAIFLIVYWVLLSYNKSNPIYPLMALIFSVALILKSYGIMMDTALQIYYFPMEAIAIYGLSMFWFSAGTLIYDIVVRGLMA